MVARRGGLRFFGALRRQILPIAIEPEKNALSRSPRRVEATLIIDERRVVVLLFAQTPAALIKIRWNLQAVES